MSTVYSRLYICYGPISNPARFEAGRPFSKWADLIHNRCKVMARFETGRVDGNKISRVDVFETGQVDVFGTGWVEDFETCWWTPMRYRTNRTIISRFRNWLDGH